MAQDKREIPIAPGLFTLPSQEGGEVRLMGSTCSVCGEVFFPARAICSKCFATGLLETPLSRTGTVYSCTVVRHPPPEYEGPVPYGLGHVELPEGVLVPTTFACSDPEVIRPGMKVTIVAEPVSLASSCGEFVTYKFCLPKEANP